MRAVRFGSYSIAATFARTPSFSRRQSMMRNRRLWPPPTCRVVMRPGALRPPDFFTGRVSFFSGFVLVTSAKSDTGMCRRAGLVGLYSLRAMVPPVRLRPLEAADGRVLAARDRGADREDVHVEELLLRLLHLDLGGLAVDLEGVLPRQLAGALVLLGDERTLHDVLDEEGRHDRLASSCFAVSAVSTSASCFRMS